MFDAFNAPAMTEEERRKRWLQQMLSPQTANATVPAFKEDAILSGAPIGVKRIAPRFNPGTPAWREENPETPQNPLAPRFQSDESVWRQKPERVQAELVPREEARPDSRSRKLKAEAYDEAPAQREKGFWRRLGSGALKGLRSYAEAGPAARELGIGGLIGAIGGGAISSAASPQLHAEWAKERKSGQLWNEYAKEMKKEAGEIDRIENISKAEKANYDARKADHDARYAAAKQYIETASADGEITPDQVEYIKRQFGIDITNPDNARYENIERGGETLTRRVNSPFFKRNPTVPVEKGDQYYEATVPGTNQKVPAKPGQLLSTAASLYAGDASRAQSQSQFKERQATAAAGARAKALAAKEGAEAELRELRASRQKAIENDEETTGLDARIAAAEREKAKAASSLKPRSIAEARSYFERRNYTEDQIKAAIKKGQKLGNIGKK